MNDINPDSLRLNIVSDVQIKTATDNSTPASGTGMLGVSFKQNYFYGSMVFNVVNRNKSLSVQDSSTTPVFANNLLIPENSGQGVSNFRFQLGLKSFAKLNRDWSVEPLISRRRLGVNAFWQMNKTEWTKDTVTSSLFISSFGITATYSLLSAQIKNADKENVHLILIAGWEARRLGGDFSLKKNETVREFFLGTDNYAFDATVLGAMLELGAFYGKVQLYNFGQKEQLDGFSGNQSLISIGMNVEFNLAAENIQPNEKMEKEVIRRADAKLERNDLKEQKKKEKIEKKEKKNKRE